MKLNFKNNSSGQVSRILIIAAVVVFLVIIVVFGVIKFTSTRAPSQQGQEDLPPEPPKPVYETTIGDIRFVLLSSYNLGNTLKSNSSFESDLTTTERFIVVVVGAQNKSKINIPQYSWDVGDIVDSEGRHFVTINDRAYSWLPKPDLCGALLKPEFDPSPCLKYYEVSKVSKGLKIIVKTTQPTKQESLMDLTVE